MRRHRRTHTHTTCTRYTSITLQPLARLNVHSIRSGSSTQARHSPFDDWAIYISQLDRITNHWPIPNLNSVAHHNLSHRNMQMAGWFFRENGIFQLDKLKCIIAGEYVCLLGCCFSRTSTWLLIQKYRFHGKHLLRLGARFSVEWGNAILVANETVVLRHLLLRLVDTSSFVL